MSARTSWLSIAGLLLLPAAPCAAAEPRALPATRAEGPITVDGKLDEPDWLRASEGTGFFEYYAPTPQLANPQTSVRALFDGRALYFGFVAYEPLMERLRAAVTDAQADVKVHADDCIELMLAPEESGQRYFHFIFNARGNYGDRLMSQSGAAADTTWHARLDCAGTIRRDRFTIEVRIPLSELDLSDRAGHTWRFQAGRNRRAAPGDAAISVFQKGGLHAPAEFARLTGLTLDLRPYLCRVTDFRVKELEPTAGGGVRVRGEAFVENKTGRFMIFELAGQASAGVGLPIEFSARGGLDHGLAKAFPVEFTTPRAGRHVLDIALRQLPERRTLHTRHVEVPITASALSMTMRRPAYRQTIYPDEKIRELEIELHSTLPAARLQGQPLRLSLHATDGAERAATGYLLTGSADARWKLPIPDLAEGSYVVRAEVARTGSAELPLRVIRRAPFFYRVDEHGRLVKNGRPLLVLGIEGALDFGQIAQWGFNYTTLIGRYPKTREEIRALAARAAEHGIMLGFNVADFATAGALARQPLTPENRQRLVERLELSRGVENILLWMLYDEPEGRDLLPELLEDQYRVMCQLDPLRPVGICNYGLTGLLAYARSGDIRRPDPYPGFWEDGSWYSKPTFVSERVDQIFSTPAQRAISAMPVLQAFGDNDERPSRGGPRHAALRNMTWLAVVHGARGLGYYSWNGIHNSPDLRLGMPALLKELRAMEPFILSVESLPAQSDAAQIHVLARRCQEGTVIVAVNAADQPIEAVLTVPGLGQRSVHVISEGRTLRSDAGRLHDRFEPAAVHIYSTQPGLDVRLPGLKSIQQAIAAEDHRREKPGNLAFFRHRPKLHFSPNAQVRRSQGPFDGYEEGYGWMPITREPDKSPVWLEVELERAQPVERVRAVTRGIEQYELSVYDRGRWAAVEGRRRERPDDQHAHTLYETDAGFDPPRVVSKVRFTVPKPTPANVFLAPAELEIYAAKGNR